MIHLNLEDSAAFLDVLEPDGTYAFRTFDDKDEKRKDLTSVHYGGKEKLRELATWNKKGAGCFVTINRTDGAGLTTNHVTAIRALWVDLDGAPLDPVQECALKPHMIVESSPDRYHAYWIVKDCPLHAFSLLQKALAVRFGADWSVSDLPRTMRIPGFYHQKSEPVLSSIVMVDMDAPYPCDEILRIDRFHEALVWALLFDLFLKRLSDPRVQKRLTQQPRVNGKKPPPLDAFAAVLSGVKKGERDDHIFRLACRLFSVLPEDDVRAVCYTENAKCIPPLSAEEVDRKVDQAKNTTRSAMVATLPRRWTGSQAPTMRKPSRSRLMMHSALS